MLVCVVGVVIQLFLTAEALSIVSTVVSATKTVLLLKKVTEKKNHETVKSACEVGSSNPLAFGRRTRIALFVCLGVATFKKSLFSECFFRASCAKKTKPVLKIDGDGRTPFLI